LSDGKLQGTPDVHKVMHHEARHLSHLVDDLHTLSLADAGELRLNLQGCLPYDLLTRTAAAYQVQAGEKNISLTVKARRDLPAVLADPDRMAQVLGNLVSNALRYTPEGGQIVLAALAGETHVSLQVQDTGAGILPDDLPHIFNRFYRADQSRQQQHGESGLGLAIARSIVEAHGGTITVESTRGQGTTFTILLPQAKSD
jgi:signal transduction histidine kinase